ncbi:MAG TPA: nitroreductase family protein, partial [Polyangium sp.]|nr:nitroreductase family protein [Polyangium sp.]
MNYPFIPLDWNELSADETTSRAISFFQQMDRRRSVRDFSDREVPREWIELAIRTASTAPSGAHRQPWRFVAVSDAEIKKRIRIAAEEEER